MKKRYLFFFVLILSLFTLASCGTDPEPTCEERGDCPETEFEPGICNRDYTNVVCNDPTDWYATSTKGGKWEFNLTKFDGKGMPIRIFVGLLSENDPSVSDYSGTRATEKQELIEKIEAAYKVDIQFVQYPDEAAWGPSRVQWVSQQATAGTYLGEVFLLDSNWITTLAGALAKLDDTRSSSKNDLFDKINYTQDPSYTQMVKMGSGVYGYTPGTPRPDTFLYYNQDLVDQYGLEDPATLWNEGKWDYAKFLSYLQNAEKQLPAASYSFNGDFVYVAEGMIAARGYSFIESVSGGASALVNLDNQNSIDLYNDLRAIYQAGYWDPNGTSTVSASFATGQALFETGGMWFYNSTMRFQGKGLKVSAVPYPTRTGDGAAKAHYTQPTGFSSTWGIANLSNASNGLTAEIVLRILDDMNRGLIPSEAAQSADPLEIYRAYLEARIDNQESVKAVLSVQNSNTYLELLEYISMSAGRGSHYLFNGYWLVGPNLIKTKDISVSGKLTEISNIYRDQVQQLFG